MKGYLFYMNFSKHSSNRKLRKLNSTNKKVTTLIGTSFVRILVFAIVALAVAGVAAGLGVANAIFDSAPEVNFEEMIPEGYTSFVMDQNGVVLQELAIGDANRIYVEIDQIPEHVANAFIATEDERFYEHNGIDMRGIFRAIFVNLREGDLSEGASTLTQQVIKNNVLSTEKSFQRKIQEQYLAVQAEKVLEKDEILELYLNTAGLGRGTSGVQAASNRYFNKDVSELTIAEAAVIAGITKRPTAYDPVINPENNKERQGVILQQMFEQGMISEFELELAKSQDVYSTIQVVNQEFEESTDYTYFVDEAIRRVASDLEVKGYLANQATNLIYRGGLSIYITQDTEIQSILDNAFSSEENFPTFEDDYNAYLQFSLSVQKADGVVHYYKEEVLQTDEEALAFMDTLKAEWVGEGEEILSENYIIIPQPQAAMVIIDYYTGHVKAMASGRGDKVGNNVFDRVTQAKRQPGSTFKVLAAYLPAIDTMGYTLGDVVDDVPTTFNVPGSPPYSPSNWYGQRSGDNFWGLSTIRKGIEWSMNVLAVSTIFDIGIETGYNKLLDLGFTTLVDSEKRADGSTYTDKVVVLPLGGLTDGVTLLELTAAYGAIANNGVYTEPIFYTKVLNHDGSILLLNEPESHTVMKETTSFLLTDAMESVVNSGTATIANFDGMHIAGKTGTTSDQKDLSFIGYTPYYVAGIWMGHDQPEKMLHNESYHKILWRNVMSEVHTDLEDRDFPMADGIVRVPICIISGKLPVEGLCDHDPRGSTVRYEYFVNGTQPTEYCDVHVKTTICTESLLLPTEFCPIDTLEERVFTARTIPLDPLSWDPEDPPRIKDFIYELPLNTEEEHCHVHTDESFQAPVLDENGNPIDPAELPGSDTLELIPPIELDEE